MTQEDKGLLLKDLCARLPFGIYVKDIRQRTKVCKIYELKPSHIYCLTLIPISDSYYYQAYSCDIDSVRPYLRPISSMTEDEKREIYDWLVENDVDWFDFIKLRLDEILISFDSSWLLVNWLNAHHFDYRGLIERGIAIEAPEEMYNSKIE